MNRTNKDSKQNLNIEEKWCLAVLWAAFAAGSISFAVHLLTDNVIFRNILSVVMFLACICLPVCALKLTRFFSLLAEQKETLDERSKILRKMAISGLLSGNIPEDISQYLPDFKGNLCVAYILYDSGIPADEIRQIAVEAFRDMGSTYFPEDEMPGRLGFVIELFPGNKEDSGTIEKTAAKFLGELKRNKKSDADVVYGRITNNPVDISVSYRVIKEAALICRKDGCVLDAEKIAERTYSIYNYTIDDESGIILYIKKGDFPKAYGLMSNALDEVVYQHGYPIYIIKCFMFELAGTILKAIGELEKENGVILGCSKNLNNIFYSDSVGAMELVLKEYLKEVCNCINASGKVVASPLCEKIKKYVRENYGDFDMNVNAIAARFYLSPAYLSNMFKRNTDMKLLDYINKVRVDEAKKMLMINPDISVEELSEKSGFKNSRTFRRTFMKLEDVPPSKFAKK